MKELPKAQSTLLLCTIEYTSLTIPIRNISYLAMHKASANPIHHVVLR